MRNKFVATVLAFFGVHKSYLGTGKSSLIFPALMVMSLALNFWPMFLVLGFIGFIQASTFSGMNTEEFNRRYNGSNPNVQNQQSKRYQRNRQKEERNRSRQAQRTHEERRPYTKPRPKPRTKARVNPYKTSGLQKFKDYEYENSIEDFEKALEIDANDIAVHFNIACAYSLTEQPKKAMYHLDQAVARGFVDFEKIKTHDALAFVRIQDEYDAFAANNFRLGAAQKPKASEGVSGDLLEQLNKLSELRKRGLLSEEEFIVEKEKLMR